MSGAQHAHVGQGLLVALCSCTYHDVAQLQGLYCSTYIWLLTCVQIYCDVNLSQPLHIKDLSMSWLSPDKRNSRPGPGGFARPVHQVSKHKPVLTIGRVAVCPAFATASGTSLHHGSVTTTYLHQLVGLTPVLWCCCSCEGSVLRVPNTQR